MKKTRKPIIRIFSAALVASIMLSFTACGSSNTNKKDSNTQAEVNDDNKTYTHEGLSITLPDTFKKSEQDTYTFYYTSDTAICLGLKESKESINTANLSVASLDDYAGIIMNKSGITSELTNYNDKAKYFTWDKKVNETDYSYIGFVTETDDAFWLIQFASLKDSFENSKNDFFKYFDSIKIN